MFVPHDFNLALLMMITSAVCWGSWANTYKGVKNYRFELFYWDYAIGIFLISLVLAFTLGSTANDSASDDDSIAAMLLALQDESGAAPAGGPVGPDGVPSGTTVHEMMSPLGSASKLKRPCESV